MRLLAVMALAVACGGHAGHRPVASAPPVAVTRSYTATRWIPAKPTYALAARSLRDAQRAITDGVDSFGMLGDVELRQVRAGLASLLAVDPLAPEALSQMGVDLDGGVAVFSQALHPTFVVHLSAPEQTQAFFDQLRDRGLQAQSQLVDGVELYTTRLAGKLAVSWAIDQDWLWVHFTLPIGVDEGTAWFDRTPRAPQWTADWEHARNGATPALVGFVDPRGLLAMISARIPEAVACARLIEPLGRVGFSIDGDGKRFGTRLALDVGPAAAAIQLANRPAPEGWAGVARGAPLAAQWNLDLLALKTWFAPCTQGLGLDIIDAIGVRAGRVILHALDPGEQEGTGVVSLDLTSKRYLAAYLDQIPLRTKFESSQRFGPYAGQHLAIPFGPTVDYVLTEEVALAGMGEGLLARAVGRGPGPRGALLALDISPPGLSKDAWEFLLRTAGISSARRVSERLLAWRDGHLTLQIDGTRLVLEVSGNRR